MRIAVTGKGGVGKSTVTGLLARALAGEGWKVLAIDADPDANLASAIGLPAERLGDLKPISQMVDLAKERTGAHSGPGNHFILNPKVDDIPDGFSVEHEGIKLLLMGTVDHAGTGCVCPEHALIRTLLRHILTRRKECVLIDMEAGIEHFGRGTVEHVDLLVVVVEPGSRSFQTGSHIETLARELGIPRICYVANKVGSAEDRAFVETSAKGRDLLAVLPLDPEVQAADREGRSFYDRPAGPARAAALASALRARLTREGD